MGEALRRRPVLLALLALNACAPPGHVWSDASVPPVPAGAARLVLYRSFEPYQSLAYVPVFLNGADVGAVGPGKIVIRDVAPGTYTIAPRSDGLWPDQAKTVTLVAGNTAYAKIESFNSLNSTADHPELQATFVVVLIAPAVATREIAGLWLES